MLLIIVISNLIFPRPCDEIGKHNGLKIRGLHGLAGSSPAKGTISNNNTRKLLIIKVYVHYMKKNLIIGAINHISNFNYSSILS